MTAFMSRNGHVVLQTLHHQEGLVGILLQVVIEVTHNQDVPAVMIR